MNYWEPEGYHQLGEGKYVAITAEAVLRRMCEATGAKSQRELADWLGVRQSCLSDACRRNIVPVRWLRVLVLKRSDYTPVWVLTGAGEKLWSAYRFAPTGL